MQNPRIKKAEYLRGGAGWALACGIPVGIAGLVFAATFTLSWSVPAMGAYTLYWVKAPFTLALSSTAILTSAVLVYVGIRNLKRARILETDAFILAALDSDGKVNPGAADAPVPLDAVYKRLKQLVDAGVIEYTVDEKRGKRYVLLSGKTD